LLGAFLTVEQDQRIWAKFKDYLTAGAAWGARTVAFGRDGDCLDPHARSFGCDGCEDGVALGADGQTVRGVFHVAAGILSAALGKDRGPYFEIRIGSVRVLESGAGGGQYLFLLFRGKGGRHDFVPPGFANRLRLATSVLNQKSDAKITLSSRPEGGATCEVEGPGVMASSTIHPRTVRRPGRPRALLGGSQNVAAQETIVADG
jgi:hypothetical protein